MNSDFERVLSVFELAQGLKRTVESATQGCWVEGEVGRLQRPASGHLYFTLKDENRDAVIDCVMYKREAFRHHKHLAEGSRVQLRGRASYYVPRGRLQWIAEVARPAGLGSLLEALEKLKAKLISEGLTAPERKKPLPSMPAVVGVVTSPTGAAIADIMTVAARRGSVRLLLSPALVQGEGAVESLCKALSLLEKARPDVIILGRGGGSAEDLMAFSDERLVRRVAACSVPIVSAVGHETDSALTDLVADARAATPSQAAELVVYDQLERLRQVRQLRLHLARSMKAQLTQCRLEVSNLQRKIRDPRFVIADEQQALDALKMRLDDGVRFRMRACRSRRDGVSQRLHRRHPTVVIARARTLLQPLTQRLVSSLRSKLDLDKSRLQQNARSLSALSPLSVLGRGYALVTAEDGLAIRDAGALSFDQSVTVRVRKGTFLARVEKVLSELENAPSFDHERATVETEGDKAP